MQGGKQQIKIDVYSHIKIPTIILITISPGPLASKGNNYMERVDDKTKRLTLHGFINMLSFALILIFIYPPLKNNPQV